jgi:hypothetical protein
MQQPVEVQVDEHEPIVERVAAIDVAKASGMVCLRIPHETIPGRRVTTVWPVAATTAALVELGDHLRAERVTRVVVESTSDYWRPFTVHAIRHRTRLKQASGTLRVGVLASCACGPEARADRRRGSSGFGSRPVCRVRPGERGSRRRSPAGPRSATSVPIPVGIGVAGRR